MLAVILAGGKGTRLKPFTMTIPKPLLPLGDVPVLDIVVRQLASEGFDRHCEQSELLGEQRCSRRAHHSGHAEGGGHASLCPPYSSQTRLA